MALLVVDGEVVAPLELARSFRARSRGLLGRQGVEGAILLSPASSVHTLRMRFPIDVALCDADLVVLRTVTMVPNRLGLPSPRARSVIEAEAGAFTRWHLATGSRLEVREQQTHYS